MTSSISSGYLSATFAEGSVRLVLIRALPVRDALKAWLLQGRAVGKAWAVGKITLKHESIITLPEIHVMFCKVCLLDVTGQ